MVDKIKGLVDKAWHDACATATAVKDKLYSGPDKFPAKESVLATTATTPLPRSSSIIHHMLAKIFCQECGANDRRSGTCRSWRSRAVKVAGGMQLA